MNTDQAIKELNDLSNRISIIYRNLRNQDFSPAVIVQLSEVTKEVASQMNWLYNSVEDAHRESYQQATVRVK